jgi:thioesterase domain-containing protein
MTAAEDREARRARLQERRGQLSTEQQRLLQERLRGTTPSTETAAAPAPARCLVEITPATGTRPPFFCVHPAGGDVLCFFPLARNLGADQPFYGLQARGLEDEREPLTCIEEMAAAYLKEIRSVQPAGPYRLGGWSFGGLAAFEMAQQLRERGEEVALVAVLDTGPGVPEWMPVDPSLIDENDPSRQLLVIAEYLHGLRGVDLGLTLADLAGQSAEEQIRRFVARLQSAGVMHAEDSFAQVRRLLRVYRTNVLAYCAYRPQPYAGRITVLRAAAQEPATDAPADLGWSAYTPLPVAAREIPGDHVTILAEPNVRVLAQTLRREIEP